MILTSKNVINTTLTFDYEWMPCFLRLWHWLLWNLVSRPLFKFHVSLAVMIPPSKSDSVWRLLMMSWLTCMQYFIWSSFSSLDAVFAQTFRMPILSIIIFQTRSFVMSDCDHSYIQQTIVTYHFPLTSEQVAESFSQLESSFISTRHCLNLFFITEKHVCTKLCYHHWLAEAFQLLW